MLDTRKLRGAVTLLSLGLTLGLSLIACATDDVADDQVDVDGEGKGDAITSSDPNRLLDTPFYFSVPKSAVTAPIDRARYPYPTVWNASMQASAVGLRVVAIQQGTGVAAHQKARREMATKLAAAGVLQDGDIVLTFRPELADTMAYPHIQMGTTHAGLIYTDGGAAFNIDSPLDSQYVGQFDTSHYAGNGGDDAGVDALHIVRPRKMTDARRVQLRTWIKTLKSGLGRINGERQQVKFQSDYLTPSFVSAGMTTRQTVTTLGKIILEADTTTKLPMFCSSSRGTCSRSRTAPPPTSAAPWPRAPPVWTRCSRRCRSSHAPRPRSASPRDHCSRCSRSPRRSARRWWARSSRPATPRSCRRATAR